MNKGKALLWALGGIATGYFPLGWVLTVIFTLGQTGGPSHGGAFTAALVLGFGFISYACWKRAIKNWKVAPRD